ncbi:MAG: class A beta-lactamase-related serine hydrolase [candidate division KSB1 bacterium]|nr:class A beta-lactamase-related serine hydrolase [candidate division KSB1 bacterium]
MDKWKALEQKIRQMAAASGGTVAVAFEDLVTGEQLLINETVAMHAASTMKTPVMIEVFKQAELGGLNLSDSILVKNEFRSIVDGSRFTLSRISDSDSSVYRHIGSKLPIRDLVVQMITRSSNLATNLLVELVGVENIMATMKSIGANRIQILRGVEDPKAFERGLNNTTDAYDMLLIMKAIAKKQILSENACNEMLSILLDQKLNRKIPALLPPGTKVAHKTGSITGIDHDAAIVYKSDDHPYVLVILTKDISSHIRAEKLIAQISKLIYDAVE